MKKLKKHIGIILSLALFAAMAMGSGSDNDGSKDIVTDDASDVVSDAGNGMEDGSDEASSDAPAPETTIEEQVLVDQDGIKVTAVAYESDDIWGDGIKLLLENNSETNVTVGCTAMIVNNYHISDLFSADIAAGKKANETLYLSSSELQAAGIETVGQIEIYFHVYNSDTWDDIFDTDVVTIQTSDYANMDTTPNDGGTEIYNDGGIRIVGKAVDENSFWGKAILLYAENTSGKNVTIQVDNLSINGFMMTPYFSCTVYDGKMAIDDITLMSSELEENGIESIDEVELTFTILDADTFQTIKATEPITFQTK